MKLKWSALVTSLIAGAVAGLVNVLLYHLLVEVCPRPLLIGLMLIVLALFVCGALFVYMHITGESDETFLFLDGKGPILIGTAVALVVLFLLGMLLEWIYDNDTGLADVPTSYIFLLDESGSMVGNDPNQERYKAVDHVMQSTSGDVPYAVYMFADSCVCVKEMGSSSQESVDEYTIGGGTMIKAALQTVLDDFNSGKLAAAGASPRVILLTDGVSADMSVMFGSGQILRAYKSAGITVSTVGLGSVDRNLLNQIAKKTGGSYVHIDKAQDLSQSFSTAVEADASRDLLSERNLVRLNWLYAILRIVFLTLLGAAIAVMRAMVCAKEDDTLMIIIVGAIAALLGAVLVEVFAALGLPVIIGQVIYWVLVSITPMQAPARRPDYGNMQLYY